MICPKRLKFIYKSTSSPLSKTALGPHPASYPMGTRDSLPGGKVAGARS